MKRFVRSAARTDILRQFRYYLTEKQLPEVAWRFLDSVERALKSIAREPRIGAPSSLAVPGLAGLRSWPVPGFEDIRVYYLETEGTVRVIRILHGKRDLRRILERDDPAFN